MNYTEFTKRKLEQHYLVQFKESTGEIVQTLSGIGNAMLKLWAIQNPRKGCETIVFRLRDGKVVFYLEKDGNIHMGKDLPDGENNIEDYCEGILAYFQDYDKKEKGGINL